MDDPSLNPLRRGHPLSEEKTPPGSSNSTRSHAISSTTRTRRPAHCATMRRWVCGGGRTHQLVALELRPDETQHGSQTGSPAGSARSCRHRHRPSSLTGETAGHATCHLFAEPTRSNVRAPRIHPLRIRRCRWWVWGATGNPASARTVQVVHDPRHPGLRVIIGRHPISAARTCRARATVPSAPSRPAIGWSVAPACAPGRPPGCSGAIPPWWRG